MSRPVDSGLGAWLNALYGAEPRRSFIEVRHRLLEVGMGRRFFGVRESRELCSFLEHCGQRTDVYVGVAPRARRAGTREAIERAHVLWADVDGAEALKRLRSFRPRPAIVVRSGSPDAVHAYWPLEVDETDPAVVERANRRLGASAERPLDRSRVDQVRMDPADAELVEAVAQRTAELVLGRLLGEELLSASEVARRLGRSRDYVYEHAAELGAVRMGDGPRPRLGFPPAKVSAWVDACLSSRRTEQPSDPGPERKVGRRQRRSLGRESDLLPIRGQEPPR